MIFANGRLLPDSQLSQVLEELDSSENYRGTSLEGLDAFGRIFLILLIWGEENQFILRLEQDGFRG